MGTCLRVYVVYCVRAYNTLAYTQVSASQLSWHALAHYNTVRHVDPLLYIIIAGSALDVSTEAKGNCVVRVRKCKWCVCVRPTRMPHPSGVVSYLAGSDNIRTPFGCAQQGRAHKTIRIYYDGYCSIRGHNHPRVYCTHHCVLSRVLLALRTELYLPLANTV